MSKSNIKGFRVTVAEDADGHTSKQLEVLPKDGTSVDQSVIDFCKQYGVTDISEVDDAEKWSQALDDVDSGHISITDVQRGQNPYRGGVFEPPERGGGL